MAGEWDVCAAIAEVIREQARSVPDVARTSGVPERTLYRIVNGQTKSVKDRTLIALAEDLDVPLSRLTGQSGSEVPDYGGHYSPVVPIPVLDQQASASLRGGVVLDHTYLREQEIPSGRVRDIVGIQVRGDCLAPDIVDGDVVIVDLARNPESGNPVVARVDETLHIKRLRVKSTGRWFLASNEGEIPIEPRQVEGVVISLQRAMAPELRRRQ